jgi:hypothetical protein
MKIDKRIHRGCGIIFTFLLLLISVAVSLAAELEVGIDIKPGDSRNSINPCSNGKIPIAILSSVDFSAADRVNRSTLTFGRSGYEASLSFCDLTPQDVNADGLADLVCHFSTPLTEFQQGDISGLLRGMTNEGDTITGDDSVSLVNARCNRAKNKTPFFPLRAIQVDGGIDEADAARGIALAKDNSVYVTGYTSTSGAGKNIWLAKYTPSLILKTSFTLDGSASGDDEGCGIAVDNDRNVYVVGYMSETDQGHDIWLAKFDRNLILKNQVTVNGSDNGADEGYGIILDGKGALYVTGTVSETGQGPNVWLAKYDTELNLLKSTTFNGLANGADAGHAVALDGSGSVFVSGSVTQAASGLDIWLGKFDTTDLGLSNQLLIAGSAAVEDEGYGIISDGKGYLYATGKISETDEDSNIWLAKYDTNLNLVRAITINGPVNDEDAAYSLSLDSQGGLYQTGEYSEASGSSNVWIAKFTTGLDRESSTTVDGPDSEYDIGYGIVRGKDKELYVAGAFTDKKEDLNIWIARYKVAN